MDDRLELQVIVYASKMLKESDGKDISMMFDAVRECCVSMANV